MPGGLRQGRYLSAHQIGPGNAGVGRQGADLHPVAGLFDAIRPVDTGEIDDVAMLGQARF